MQTVTCEANSVEQTPLNVARGKFSQETKLPRPQFTPVRHVSLIPLPFLRCVYPVQTHRGRTLKRRPHQNHKHDRQMGK